MKKHTYLNGIMAALFFITVAYALAVTNSTADVRPDYEAQANCIAEYDYQHPERQTMDNLVAALQLCKK
jgi:hypothetical protein